MLQVAYSMFMPYCTPVASDRILHVPRGSQGMELPSQHGAICCLARSMTGPRKGERGHLQDGLKAKVLALPECELAGIGAREAPATLRGPCNGIDARSHLIWHANLSRTQVVANNGHSVYNSLNLQHLMCILPATPTPDTASSPPSHLQFDKHLACGNRKQPQIPPGWDSAGLNAHPINFLNAKQMRIFTSANGTIPSASSG